MSAPSSASPPGSPCDWLQQAESDLHYARLGSRDSGVLPNQAGFHAQQAVEKALKGLLLHRQILFSRTHDLNLLIELLKRSGITWPVQFEDAKNLTPFAVQMRYPGYTAQLSRKDLEQAIQLADGVLVWIKSELGIT